MNSPTLLFLVPSPGLFCSGTCTVLQVLLDEGPQRFALGRINAVHLEDVFPEWACLDEAMLTEGTNVGLLPRVSHSVVSVVYGRVLL